MAPPIGLEPKPSGDITTQTFFFIIVWLSWLSVEDCWLSNMPLNISESHLASPAATLIISFKEVLL
jgi:hypothetical protein